MPAKTAAQDDIFAAYALAANIHDSLDGTMDQGLPLPLYGIMVQR